MSKELIAEVFNRSAEMYDNAGVKFFSHFGNRLVEKLQMHNGAKVLDIGCGKGAAMIPASKSVGAEGFVEGIDISIGMLDQLNKRLDDLSITNTRTFLMDVDDMGFAENSFDFITGSFVLFFFQDPLSTLKKIKPLLTSNGKVCCATFSNSSQLEWVRDLVLQYLPELDETSKNKERFDTKEALHKIFIDADFTNVRVEEETHTFFYSNEKRWFEELWSHGFRHALESMTDENLANFKIDCVQNLERFRREDGFHIPISVLFTFAEN